MNKFLFKSTDADFKKMFSIIEIIQKNIVYETYRVDQILKLLKEFKTNNGLQLQVDKYFDSDDTEHIPEENQG